MTVLTVLTVAWAVILVLALAGGLIAILAALTSVGTNLEQIAAGFKVVETETAPLEGHLEAVNSALASVGGGMKSVYSHLAGADEALGQAGESLSARSR